MTCEFTIDGTTYLVTTDRSESSYGIPVLLVNDEITDISVYYCRDRQEQSSPLPRNPHGKW